MRAVLTALLVVLCAPASAGAAFAPPVSIPASSGEVPRALAFAGGRGVVVTQSGGAPYSRATIAAVTVPSGRRTTFADSAILDSVARQDGGVDVLVRHGSDPTKRADLILRRVLPSGKVFDLWSVRTAASEGALARGRDRTVVVWPEGSTLRIVTRPDGGIPSRPRIARLGLRGVIDLDLAVDARGRLVTAVSYSSLVLASLTTRGTVLRRQVAPGVSGLVEIAVTAGGRVGVLVEDTGIEGEGGECVADHGGRHVRVAVRERGAARFGSPQTVQSPRFGCGSAGALLRALPADGLAVIYQGGSYDFPPLLARVATAARGQRFGAPATLASDARADSAVVTASGQLVTVLLRRSVQPELFSGALSVLRSNGSEEVVDAGPASSPLLGAARDGIAVLAWRSGESLKIAADQP